jgi:hypothetical protein
LRWWSFSVDISEDQAKKNAVTLKKIITDSGTFFMGFEPTTSEIPKFFPHSKIGIFYKSSKTLPNLHEKSQK